MRRINYKRLILKALAEQADLTIGALVDAMGEIFASKPESYRRLRAGMNPGGRSGSGMDFFSRMVSENAIRVTLARLKKDGLVRSSGRGIWSLDAAGKTYLEDDAIKPPRTEISVSDARIMVIFDVPEYLKREREWLRKILERSGFMLLQKSVWVGRDALAEEFFEEIGRRRLQSYVHILGIQNLGTVGER